MRNSFYAMLVVVLTGIVLLSNGCKDDENPVTAESVPQNIFPLIQGHRFNYSGYFTNQDTETPITGTSSFYSTSWTIGSSATPLNAVFGPLASAISAANNGITSATLIYDSTLIAPPLAPITFTKFTPVFAYYDTANGDYYYLTNLGYFYRSSKINKSATDTTARADSLRFIKLASTKAKVGEEFTCFEENFTSYSNPVASTPINLRIFGKWENKQELTLNEQTYTAYYLIIKRKAKAGAIEQEGTTAKLWLVAGVGPVKMFLAGDAETPGNYRELSSKNFN